MSLSLEAKKNQAGAKKSSSSSTTISGRYRRHFPFFPVMHFSQKDIHVQKEDLEGEMPMEGHPCHTMHEKE
jgi:hypothetical protein